ncbi:MAG: Na+/H+ antiporter subunit C [Phycisphaeraceae bacterium]|nr:Na+/H+ antiporter subunit C [Phycisphaeraceae bacterium]
MELLFAIIAGVLFAAGLYLMLRRSILKLVMGLVLIGHSANITIFTAGGLTRARSAIIAADAATLPAGSADPLPQALILTAIVISFGVLAFAIVLVSRAWQEVGNDDTDQFAETDR